MANRFAQATTLAEVVGQAVGAGSVCWVGGTGALEFDSTAATKVVEDALARIADLLLESSLKGNL